MCYGGDYSYKDELETEFHWTQRDTLKALAESERIKNETEHWFFPKNMVPAIFKGTNGYQTEPMRFDLIHAGYAAQYPDATLPELIKLKDSRRIDPKRKKPFGYSSFNARSEEIASKWTFKGAWKNGDRCIIPVTRIYENANMDGAPKEFQNKSYKLNLEHTAYLGCIYARIERQDQELYSFSIVTLTSDGHRIRKEIWHERMPVLLNQSEAELWMDPKFPAEAAWNMVKQYPGDEFLIEPWIKAKAA